MVEGKEFFRLLLIQNLLNSVGQQCHSLGLEASDFLLVS